MPSSAVTSGQGGCHDERENGQHAGEQPSPSRSRRLLVESLAAGRLGQPVEQGWEPGIGLAELRLDPGEDPGLAIWPARLHCGCSKPAVNATYRPLRCAAGGTAAVPRCATSHAPAGPHGLSNRPQPSRGTAEGTQGTATQADNRPGGTGQRTHRPGIRRLARSWAGRSSPAYSLANITSMDANCGAEIESVRRVHRKRCR